MFESLQENLSSALRALRGRGRLTESNMREGLQSVQRALLEADVSLPVVTCGVTHGLSIAGYLLVDAGDKIILSDLYWENYDLVYSNAFGAEFQFFNFFKNGLFDIASFKKAINMGPVGKKIVILNFPNNPSGYTPTKAAGQQVIQVLKEAAEAGNKLAVILDDSYFGLFFEEDILTESLFAALSHLHENLLAIKVDGITKEEYAWGFRIGFITFGVKNGTAALYKALEEKTAGAVRGNISNSSHPSQSLFINSLKSESHQSEKQKNRDKIKERYLKVKSVLQQHPEYEKYFAPLPFNSGYFMCVQLKGPDADKVWRTLLDKYSTGVICYSEKKLFRIAFASTPDSGPTPIGLVVLRSCTSVLWTAAVSGGTSLAPTAISCVSISLR